MNGQNLLKSVVLEGQNPLKSVVLFGYSIKIHYLCIIKTKRFLEEPEYGINSLPRPDASILPKF